jgi:hypothetical protein
MKECLLVFREIALVRAFGIEKGKSCLLKPSCFFKN